VRFSGSEVTQHKFLIVQDAEEDTVEFRCSEST
jgi:hypothetical protein